MGKTKSLIFAVLLVMLCLHVFQENGHSAVYQIMTEGNGIINKDTGQQNTNGAMVWTGSEWVVNSTWQHKFFVDPNTGQRWKNYDNPQTVIGTSPTGVILNFGNYQVTRNIYSYTKSALNGTGSYIYQVIEYVTRDTITGKDIILRSGGTGNGTSSAYFDVYIDDDVAQGISPQVTAFRGDPVWFTYPGRASDAINQKSPLLNRSGDMPSVSLPPTFPQHSNGYYLDQGGGSDMGGKSFQLITQTLTNLTTNLNSSYIVQFNLKWLDSQANLQMISFFPSIVSETFQAAPVNAATPVPTLSEWGMILLALLAGLLATKYLKKRNV